MINSLKLWGSSILYVPHKNVQNFDPFHVPIMQSFALRDPFPCAYLLISINITYLIFYHLVLPRETKQIADGPTTTCTFTVMLIQRQVFKFINSTIDNNYWLWGTSVYLKEISKHFFDSVPSAFQHLWRIWLQSLFASDQNLHMQIKTVHLFRRLSYSSLAAKTFVERKSIKVAH